MLKYSYIPAMHNYQQLMQYHQSFTSVQQGMYRYKQKHGHRRSFAQWHRAADKRESTSGLRNRSFFWPLFMTDAAV
jgi:hypothetical protein